MSSFALLQNQPAGQWLGLEKRGYREEENTSFHRHIQP